MPEGDLRSYFDRKRTMVLWSLASGIVIAVGSLPASGVAAVAALTGSVCGVLNALATMAGNESLAKPGGLVVFALTGIARFVVFGGVPVVFALHGPAWSMLPYYVAFFSPLATYLLSVGRGRRVLGEARS